ncbi:unnamed protein product [Anisakis simplex]|uniref:Protein-tyrosine phosphatase n=1 Tax=Anisakis simplex TaxID=6269 RepID=A0A0M3JZY4_ANISI|nr:unnamed protein product [Anisakis simplex]
MWVEKTLQKDINGLRKEFRLLHNEVIPRISDCQEYFKNANTGRNRYGNVYCLDRSRVILKVPPKMNDYIHANYIDTPFKKHRFICTQGPTEASASDFWLMVLQEHVEFIIMLSKFKEKGREKCCRYFPEMCESTVQFGPFTIRCDSNSVILMLIKLKVRMSVQPIVVHCSAGIGRSGVLITVEYILELLTFQKDCSNMFNIIKELRSQRAGLVQTIQQYLFIHRLLLLFFIDAQRCEPTKEVSNFIKNYEAYVHRQRITS